MTNIYIKYLFKNEATAKEAITALIDEKDAVASFGIGEKQLIGFDVEEGQLSFSNHTVDSEELCLVEWKAMSQDAGEENAWLSPHCFENYDTFALNGNNIKGEECDFGIKEGE